MLNLLQRIRIVLVETSHPGNIGAAARAMKTMGLEQLVLVRPADYPCAEATARASGADDVLAAARVCDTLDEALADCVLVIGTSARERRLEWPHLSPEAGAARLLEGAGDAEVALVFGRERYGLTNDELARCQYALTVDANPDYSSLNLAATVQVLCYELRKQSAVEDRERRPRSANEDERPATAAELEGFYEHLEQTLAHIGITEPDRPKPTLMRRLRRLFYRASLSVIEVNILRGILSAAQGRKRPRD
jgi:TrmH family RNA methyltransferase